MKKQYTTSGEVVVEALESRKLLAGDMVLDWNDVATEVIRQDTTMGGPTRASRNVAIMHAAIFDAVNAIDGSYRPYAVKVGNVHKNTSIEAAVAAAAHRVLEKIYPASQQLLDDALTDSLAEVPDGKAEKRGVKLGEHVANKILKLRKHDGANEMMDYEFTNEPGHWQIDPMNPGQSAMTPLWGDVTPFAMKDVDDFMPVAPPAMTSDEYAEAYNEVKAFGEKESAVRTDDQTEIGIFWAYDRGGLGPPNILYNQIAQTIANNEGNTLVENARLFNLLNIAMADAGISCWAGKYEFDIWRPITGIREGDTDGNPNTEADEDWIPLGAPGGGVVPDFTPPFPAYTSGHATFGAAAFRTLEHFYGTDDMEFTITSDELPGVTRSYTSFSQASEENGQSRIYLGIHWAFDKEQGIVCGNDIADMVFETISTPKKHSGKPRDCFVRDFKNSDSPSFGDGKIESIFDSLDDNDDDEPGRGKGNNKKGRA